MPDFTERPNEKFLDDASKYYREMWEPAHKNWRHWDEYYHRTYELWDKLLDAAQITRPSYRPSTPTSLIDHAADAQLAFSPKVHRDPVGTGKTARTDADEVEVGVKDIMDTSVQGKTTQPWKEAGRYGLHYGYFVIEAPTLDFTGRIPKPKRAKGESEEDFKGREGQFRAHKQGWNPIRIDAPHPAHVLLDPEEKESRIAIKVSQQAAGNLFDESKRKKTTRHYANLLDMAKLNPWEHLVREDIWTPFWHTVRVKDGQILWVEKNTWGFVPFLHGFAGFGMKPVDLEKVDPSFQAVGLLAPVLDSIKVQAQSATAKHQITLDTAFAELLTTEDPGDLAEQLDSGNTIVRGDSTKMGRMPVAQFDRSLMEIDRIVTADIEEGSYARDVAGLRQTGVNTVGQQRLLSSASQKKFLPLLIQLESVGSLTGSRICQLVDTVSTLHGQIRNLRKSQINGNYDLRVTFEVSDPVLQLRKKEVGMQEVTLDLLDPVTYWEQTGEENISQRQKRLDQARVRRHPSVARFYAELAAKELGLPDDAFDPDFVEGEEGAPPPASPNGKSQFAGEPGTEAQAVSDVGNILDESSLQGIEGA
jgi:hypothetical protein